jgi:hypothetical protein
MGLLDFDDTYKPPFTGRRKEPVKDNFAELQNLGREKIAEDFEDSKFADRKPLKEEFDSL